jgi:hypothetical protein
VEQATIVLLLKIVGVIWLALDHHEYAKDCLDINARFLLIVVVMNVVLIMQTNVIK